jgi:SAM-dependent methyltransferase
MLVYQDEWWSHKRISGDRECAARWALIKDHVHQQGTLVDVGANLGYYSLRAVQEYPTLHAIAVEADWSIAAKQRVIVSSWDHDRVSVVVGKISAAHAKAVRESGERIDTLLLLACLHWFDDPAAVMTELSRCAKRIIVELDDACGSDVRTQWSEGQQVWLETVTSGVATLLGRPERQTSQHRSWLWCIETGADLSGPPCKPERFGDVLPRAMWWDEQLRQVVQWGVFSEEQFSELGQRWSNVAQTIGATDAGPLGPLSNGNVVRRVVLADHRAGVLKVPVVTRGAEASTLEAWCALDCTVELLASGPNNSWLLTGFEHGVEPTSPLSTDMLRQATELTSALHVKAAACFHDVTTRTRDAMINDRAALAQEGHVLPQHLLETLFEGMLSNDEVVVHGDFRSRNTLVRQRDTRLVAFDPTGGRGPAEVDMAHWVAIASALSGVSPYLALDVVCSIDARLDRHRLNCWCAASLLGVACGELSTRFATASIATLLEWVGTLSTSGASSRA